MTVASGIIDFVRKARLLCAVRDPARRAYKSGSIPAMGSRADSAALHTLLPIPLSADGRAALSAEEAVAPFIRNGSRFLQQPGKSVCRRG